MIREVRSTTFKSGNSVALRLPKSLGIAEGVEMRVREEQGKYVIEPVKSGRETIDLSFLKGRTAGLKPLRPEDREVEHRALDWGGKMLVRD